MSGVYRNYMREGRIVWSRVDLIHKGREMNMCWHCHHKDNCQALKILGPILEMFVLEAPVFACPEFKPKGSTLVEGPLGIAKGE